MKKRVITGIVMALVLVPVLWLGGWYLSITATILAYIATYELLKMHTEKRNICKKYQYILPLFSAMLVLLGSFSILLPKYFATSDLIYSLLVIFVLLLVFSLFNKELKVTDIMLFYAFILYSGLGIYMAIRCRYVNTINGVTNKYLGLILMSYLLITTMFTDMGAYTFGLLCGKHKLCPTISPKKTIEGAIGGSFTGALLGTIFLVLFSHFMGFKLVRIDNPVLYIIVIALISLLITIFAQLGDLVASKLKREYEIKDYGFIFPGHGGVMDRFDSLIITGSMFIIILIMIGVIVL